MDKTHNIVVTINSCVISLRMQCRQRPKDAADVTFVHLLSSSNQHGCGRIIPVV